MATTQLLQIDKKIMWDDKCEASLTEFKTRLTTTPIFTLPSDMEGFIIYSNVSLKELECVLIQHEKVVAHTFRQLRLYEKNYTIHNLEFIVVVFALKIQRHYLYEAKFKIFTNNKSHKYVLTLPNLKMRQQHWLELLEDYDCDIQYYLGKINRLVNALSRKLSIMVANLQVEAELMTQIWELQNCSVVLQKIVQEIKEGKETKFRVDNGGLLYYQEKLCMLDNAKLWMKILKETYHSIYSIYPNNTKMYQDLRQYYQWQHMKADIALCVTHYLNCQQVKEEHTKLEGLLNPMRVPVWKWVNIVMDFV